MMKVGGMDGVMLEVDDRRKAIDELVRGREFANQLRQQITDINDNNNNDDLVRNVLRSFANTIFLLSKYPTFQSLLVLKSEDQDQDQDQQDLTKSFLNSTPTSATTTLTDTSRAFSKRKRNMETWRRESRSQTDHDEHQWRKYGQKHIQNAKYERNYYRCTHKYDEGCQATKQVQMVRDKPSPCYRVTYYGHHTCRNPAQQNHHQFLLLDHNHSPHSSCSDSSILLSFDNSFPNPTNNPFFSSSREQHLILSSTSSSSSHQQPQFFEHWDAAISGLYYGSSHLDANNNDYHNYFPFMPDFGNYTTTTN